MVALFSKKDVVPANAIGQAKDSDEMCVLVSDKGRAQVRRLPLTPWQLMEDALLITDGAGRFIIRDESGMLRYFGRSRNFFEPAQLYQKKNGVLSVDDYDSLLAKTEIDAQTNDAVGEFLGEFDFPLSLWFAMKAARHYVSRHASESLIGRAMRSRAGVFIRCDCSGGVTIRVDANIAFPAEFGVIGTMETNVPLGRLKDGVELVIGYEALLAILPIYKFAKDGVTIRVTRSNTDQDEAVLVWTSPVWDGSYLTKAKVVDL